MAATPPPPSGRPGMMGWSSQMRDELSRLPETAANIREASENLKRVSAELVDVSAMLARILRIMEATGVTEGLSRVERVSSELDAVRKALTPPTSLDEAKERLAMVEDMVSGLSKGVLRTVGLAGTGRRPETARPGTARPETARPDPPADDDPDLE